MSPSRRHVIRRECIDLAVEGGESEGIALQGRIAALCEGALATALDEAFARAVPGDEHWQFERIEVDAGCFTPESFERDFVAAVAAAVEEQVRARKAQAVAQPAIAAEEADVRWSGAQSIHEAFLYFLATGALPWWCRLPEGRTLEAVVSEAWIDTGARAEIESAVDVQGQGVPAGMPLRAALLRTLVSPVARLRLARQFPADFLERLLERLAPASPAILREVVAAVHRATALAVPDAVPEQAWAAAFAVVATHGAIAPRRLLEAWAAVDPGLVTPDVVDAVIAPGRTHDGTTALKHHGGDTTATERHAMTSKTTPTHHHTDSAAGTPPATQSDTAAASAAASAKPLDLHDGVFVDCAGIVLLHAFLPMLFERRGIAADGRIVQPDRALALLHFLATGQPSAPEYALVLPKLLCGMEPSALAGPPVELGEEDRREAESMLQAAIDYWPAIGHTSLDGFRGNFLVRPGKLSRRGDDDLLQVEKRSWDILLGQLPWSMGLVRMPWMPRMLWVEWPH